MAGAPRQGGRGEALEWDVAKGRHQKQPFPSPSVAAKHRARGGVGNKSGRVKRAPKAGALLTFSYPNRLKC